MDNYYKIGLAHQINDDLENAMNSYNMAIENSEDSAELFCNIGLIHMEKNNFHESGFWLKKSLEQSHSTAITLNNIGVLKLRSNDIEGALEYFNSALLVSNNYCEAMSNAGQTCILLNRPTKAAEYFSRLYEVNPDYPYILGNILFAKLSACDFNGVDQLTNEAINKVKICSTVIHPYISLYLGLSEAVLKKIAVDYVNENYKQQNIEYAKNYVTHENNNKILIGFLGGEFREQATSILIAGLLEEINKSEFEVHIFDNGYDDHSNIRKRIECSAYKLHDISCIDDTDAAVLINKIGINILFNLNGYFGKGRMGIFARRPCKVQINYLGFPGTLGAEYIDYVIADETVIPVTNNVNYTEKVLYLPNCYQPNDDKRYIPSLELCKTEHKLDDWFYFGNFNFPYKIKKEQIDVWIQIMSACPKSRLVLLGVSHDSIENIKSYAGSFGIRDDRILSWTVVSPESHLKRLACIDLVLDTIPYNVHTTGSDALWAGVPILTMEGNTFAGRVCSSLLKNVEMDYLICNTVNQYINKAIEIYADDRLLFKIKENIRNGRKKFNLFNTIKYTRHFEKLLKDIHSNNNS